jgi:hypothetical protein
MTAELHTLTLQELRQRLAQCNADPCPDHSTSGDYRAAIVREIALRRATK